MAEAALDDRLPPALLVLTGVTGLVDAVSFLGLGHIFTANMTGNVVFLGFAAAGVPGLSVARSSTSLVAFLAGAALGGRLRVAMAGVSRRRWLLTFATSFIFGRNSRGLSSSARAIPARRGSLRGWRTRRSRCDGSRRRYDRPGDRCERPRTAGVKTAPHENARHGGRCSRRRHRLLLPLGWREHGGASTRAGRGCRWSVRPKGSGREPPHSARARTAPEARRA